MLRSKVSIEDIHSLNVKGVNLAQKQEFSEACRILRLAISIAPKHAPTYHNLGAVLTMNGSLQEAALTFTEALRLDPNSTKSHFNLANVYKQLGKLDESLFHLKQVIAMDPDHHSANHLLASMTGVATVEPPRDYIIKLFDQYAATFEESLINDLGYKTPELLKSILIDSYSTDLYFEQAIDLGCGTGLVAKMFRSCAGVLHGVDLSSKMIEKAKLKNLYDLLSHGDLVEHLTQSQNKYDLFIAADTFVYLGNLEPVFHAMANCSKSGATYVFSTEKTHEAPFVLRPTGRFAHSYSYINEMAEKNSMKIVNAQETQLRKDGSEWVLGDVYMLRFLK